MATQLTKNPIPQHLRTSIPSPSKGTRTSVNCVPGNVCIFEFNPNDATVVREGDHLSFTLEEGTVVLVNFFQVGGVGLPAFQLPDESTVNAEEFLSEFEIALYVAPTPTYSSVLSMSSGALEYDDNAGHLIESVSRFPDLDTFYWGRTQDKDIKGDYPGVVATDPDYVPPSDNTQTRAQGPYIVITGQKVVNESGAITNDLAGERNFASYSLVIMNSLGQPVTSASATTVTLLLDFGTALNTDIDLSAITLSNGSPITINGPDGNGNYSLQITVPANTSSISFKIPIVDDHVGGNPTTGNEADETYSLQITGVSSTEVELWNKSDHGNPPSYLDSGQTFYGDRINTTIKDDSNPAHTNDGPIVNVVLFGAPTVAATEGQNRFFTLDLKDPSNPTNPYSGFHGNAELSDDMTVVLQVTGLGGATYGQSGDFYMPAFQPLLDDAITDGILQSFTINQTTGTITLVFKAGSSLTDVSSCPVQVSINTDSTTESNEGFSVAVISTTGNESKPGETSVEQAIIDADTGPYVNIQNIPSEVEGTDLIFLLTVSTTVGGPNDISLVDANQPITVTLAFEQNALGGARFDPTGGTDSSTAQDYDLDALLTSLSAYSPTITYSGDQAFLTLTISKTQWGANGVEIRIPTVNDSFSEGNETFPIDIIDVTGSQGKIGLDTTLGTIKDDLSLKIDVTSVTSPIYEDPNTSPNVALFVIDFTNVQGPAVAVENFSFTATLTNGTATYDGNTTNDGTAANIGDFRWAFQDDLVTAGVPGAATMTSSPALITAINAWLTAGGYLSPGLEVTAIGGMNGTRLTLTGTPGYTFSNSLTLPVKAIDDLQTEGSEGFKLVIGNATGNESYIGTSEQIASIEPDPGADPRAFKINIPDTFTVNESQPGTLDYVINLLKGDGTPATAADLAAGISQNTTLTLTFTGSGTNAAKAFYDYRVDNMVEGPPGTWTVNVTIKPGDWTDIGGGNLGFKIPINVTDNALTDGTRHSDISIGGISGNEITLDGSPTTALTITDDTIEPSILDPDGIYDDTNREGLNILDGPKFNKFSQKDATESEPLMGVAKTITYGILFDSKIEEPIFITLDLTTLNANTNIQLNGDVNVLHPDVNLCSAGSNLGFVDLNTGLITYNGATYPTELSAWNAITGQSLSALPPYAVGAFTPGQYFTIGQVGETSAHFTIEILADRISESNEGLHWEITGMVGNEVLFDPQVDPTLTTNILDNGDGPHVTLASDGDKTAQTDNSSNAFTSYDLGISNKGDEPYTISFHIVHGDGTTANTFSSIEIFGPDGITPLGLATLAPGSTAEISYYTFTIDPTVAPANGFAEPTTLKIHVNVAQNLSSHGEQIFYFGTESSTGAESSAESNYIAGKIVGNDGSNPTNTISLTPNGPTSALEGDQGDSNGVEYTLTRTDGSVGDEVVHMTLIPGEGITPDDLDFGPNVTVVWNADGTATLSVTIPANSTSVNFESIFTGDANAEKNENFTLILTGSDQNSLIDINANIVDSTIVDDDTPQYDISIEPNTSSANYDPNGDGFIEGGRADMYLVVTADPSNKTGVTSESMVVTFTYGNGTAHAGEQYNPPTYQITIPAGTPIAPGGVIKIPFDIELADNKLTDGTTNFTVGIESATGSNVGAINTTPVPVDILDDVNAPDGPIISLTGSSGALVGTNGTNYVSESGNSEITLSYSADSIPLEDVTIDLHFEGDSAEIQNTQYFDGTNWVNVPADGNISITLPEGANKVDLKFRPIDDSLSNGNNSLTVNITNITGAEAHTNAGSDEAYTVVIVDDSIAFNENGITIPASPDGPKVSIGNLTNTTIAENGATTQTSVDIALATPTSEDVTVTVQIPTGMLPRISLYDALGNPWVSGPTYVQLAPSTYVEVDNTGKVNITIPSGQTVATLNLQGNNNSIAEGAIQYPIKIIGTTGGETTINSSNTTVNLTIEDGPVAFTLPSSMAEETATTDITPFLRALALDESRNTFNAPALLAASGAITLVGTQEQEPLETQHYEDEFIFEEAFTLTVEDAELINFAHLILADETILAEQTYGVESGKINTDLTYEPNVAIPFEVIPATKALIFEEQSIFAEDVAKTTVLEETMPEATTLEENTFGESLHAPNNQENIELETTFVEQKDTTEYLILEHDTLPIESLWQENVTENNKDVTEEYAHDESHMNVDIFAPTTFEKYYSEGDEHPFTTDIFATKTETFIQSTITLEEEAEQLILQVLTY